MADFGEDKVKCIINENLQNEDYVAIADNYSEKIEVVRSAK